MAISRHELRERSFMRDPEVRQMIEKAGPIH